ncbi:MAG: YceD family protein [Vicinamibacterales bacterium]
MKLDLGKIRQAETRYDRTFEPSDVAMPDDDYRIVAPVRLGFDIHKDKEKFRLVGTVRTELELLCSRCLEPFRLPVDLAFDQRYLPQAEASAGEEIEVAEEDLETSFYRDQQIDLNELIREQCYLALPMKPLCEEACKGLCARCGTNLNAGSCDCAPVWEDPRLAALKQLKTRES